MSGGDEQLCAGPGEHGLCDCITAHAREIMRHWTGTNCTWADDDITALGILAGHAIRAGMHRFASIPTTLMDAIDAHEASPLPHETEINTWLTQLETDALPLGETTTSTTGEGG